jgi:ABC-type antimicrobial peptide transport system permease subunit
MFVHLPQIYSYGYMNLAVRTRGEPLLVADAIKREVRTLDPDQPIGVITTMPDLLSASEGRRRFTLILLLAFAAVGLALAAIGVYGVVAYTVEQRTREIGIRLALGAVPGELMGSVLISGLRLALMGVGIGMLGAAVLTRLLRSQLFELSPLDPLSFGATGLLIAIIALLATWLPARRTLKVDPLTALRHE